MVNVFTFICFVVGKTKACCVCIFTLLVCPHTTHHDIHITPVVMRHFFVLQHLLAHTIASINSTLTSNFDYFFATTIFFFCTVYFFFIIGIILGVTSVWEYDSDSSYQPHLINIISLSKYSGGNNVNQHMVFL